jgi:quercetin 2,3-dioxygenase
VIVRRPSEERGRTRLGWLDSRHTFSFGDYLDPAHMGFRDLRVINEDWIEPGRGFPTHGHRDMEILTYVLEGALEHRDSLGTGSIIRPGEVQRMTAGTGVTHSEQNPSPTEPVHLLQIWVLPEQAGLAPSYEQRAFPAPEKAGRLRLVASRDGAAGSVTVHQHVALYAATLAPGDEIVHELGAGRHAWLQVARGAVVLGGTTVGQGDGAAVTQERRIALRGSEPAEILLFDLA